ncbi:MMPL family transporter [Sulfurospirillum diekertiae]|uniref:MMPL family transporter n=2 Tax=Sulfurospirillum diekertiae TaxID=1854492 RepID=A0A6G9VUS2_9BACT|nr:MMPL family transporter [Sulfurospirillum diekertiae]QIR79915.1 MMPL family transporter [Sulfurospirillum diekertiae]
MYSDFITKNHKIVLSILLLVTLFLGYFAVHLSVDASAETLLLENDKDLQLTREIHKRYTSSDYLVISFSPNDPMLSEKSLNTIRSLKEALLKVDSVKSVVSILDVPLLESPPRSIKEFIDDIRTLESKDINKTMVQEEFTTSPIYKNNLVSADFKTTGILINLKDDTKYMEFVKARNALLDKQKVEKLTKEESLQLKHIQKEFKEYREVVKDKSHSVIKEVRDIIDMHKDSGQLFLGGVMMVADDMISFVKDDIKTYGISVILIMVLVLWIIFRQLRYVLIPVTVAFSAVVITAGLYTLFGLEVTVISSNFVSMQLIMAISLSIHLVSNYRENYIKNPELSQKEIIAITMEKMVLPMSFVVCSSIVAYMSLISSGILPVMNFGWMMAVASCISFLFAIIFSPAMLMALKKKAPVLTYDKFTKLTLACANAVKAYPKTIYLGSLAVVIFSIVGTTQLIVENSMINYFRDKTEIYQGMKKIDENLGGTTPLEVVVRFPKKQASMEKSSDPSVLDSFEEEFNKQSGEAQYWFTDQKMEEILKIQTFLESMNNVGNVSSLATLLRVGKIIKNGQGLDSFELGILYKALPEEDKNMLLDSYINIENDEARFIIRIKDSSKDLRREELINTIRAGLEKEIGLKESDFDIVGMMVLYNNMLQSLYQTQILTVGETISILGLMFLFLFRSVKIGLIAIVVNIIPIGIVFGIMGVFKIPLDIMNITIAAIAFDMAMNNTVYYYLRFRAELKKDGDYVATMVRSHASVGNPMYYCAGVTVIGFMVLVTSNFVPTIVFGLLTVATIFVAIVADLLLSPLLLITFKAFGTPKTKEL